MSLVTRGPLALLAGATYPLRALWIFIKHPYLGRYVWIPILINVFLGITLYAGLLYAGFEAIDLLFSSIPGWVANLPHWVDPADWQAPTLALPHWNIPWPHWQIQWPQIQWPQIQWPQIQWPHWTITFPNWWPDFSQWEIRLPDWMAQIPGWGFIALLWLLRLVLTIILFIVTGFILLQFGVLLGAPWYGKLSEELEKLKTGKVELIEVGMAEDISRAILYELKKLVLSIGVGLPLLLVGFLPGVGTAIATTGGIILAASIVCLDFLDSTLERRRLRFRQKLSLVFRSLPASGTFGFVCLGLVSIPFINLLAIPLCVTAGTLFSCDRILPTLQKSTPEQMQA